MKPASPTPIEAMQFLELSYTMPADRLRLLRTNAMTSPPDRAAALVRLHCPKLPYLAAEAFVTWLKTAKPPNL